MRDLTGRVALALVFVLAMLGTEVGAQSQPDGQLTIAFDASIAPAFLDPAETPGSPPRSRSCMPCTMRLVKPLPGNDMAPCLAESWKESPDGLVYEFKLREGLKFHNGDPFTAADVKFSFQRYRGASAKLLHERVQTVEIIDQHRVRFVLKQALARFPGVLRHGPPPAPPGSCPRRTSRRSARRAFRRHPVGLGPIGL